MLGEVYPFRRCSIDPIVAIDPRSVVRNRPIRTRVFSLGPPAFRRRRTIERRVYNGETTVSLKATLAGRSTFR